MRQEAQRLVQYCCHVKHLSRMQQALLSPRPVAHLKIGLFGAGTRELVTACCTFGNSLTLPLVFMMSLLPPRGFDRAAGYTALFLVGWSPLLWTYGYQLLGSAAHPSPEGMRLPPRQIGSTATNA